MPRKMKKKNRTVSFIVIHLIFLFLLFLPSILFAQVYDNIRFRKDVPEEIRGQLVLCPIRVDNPPPISSK